MTITPTPAQVQACLDAIELETTIGSLVKTSLRARVKQAPLHLRIRWRLEARWFLIRKPHWYWRFVHACRRMAAQCEFGTDRLRDCDGCGAYVPVNIETGYAYRDEAWFCGRCGDCRFPAS